MKLFPSSRIKPKSPWNQQQDSILVYWGALSNPAVPDEPSIGRKLAITARQMDKDIYILRVSIILDEGESIYSCRQPWGKRENCPRIVLHSEKQIVAVHGMAECGKRLPTSQGVVELRPVEGNKVALIQSVQVTAGHGDICGTVRFTICGEGFELTRTEAFRIPIRKGN